MQDLNGKVAFITGGASGIGLSMAQAFGAEGMAVMLADIEPAALERACRKLAGSDGSSRWSSPACCRPRPTRGRSCPRGWARPPKNWRKPSQAAWSGSGY